jgi:hypothetical protein
MLLGAPEKSPFRSWQTLISTHRERHLNVRYYQTRGDFGRTRRDRRFFERCTGAKKYDTGATDTEIKIGNIMPYSGPASAYGVIEDGRGLLPRSTPRAQRPQDQLHLLRRRLLAAEDGGAGSKLVESDEVLLIFNPLGTPPTRRSRNT